MESISDLVEWYNDFYSEERRIQRLIDEAVNEEHLKWQKKIDKVKAENEKKVKLLAENRRKLEKERAESKKEVEKLHANEVIHLSELNASPEKIAEITDFPLDFINEVLNKNQFDLELSE